VPVGDACFGVDFSTVYFSISAWQSQGAVIGPNGTHYIGAGQISPTASGLSIDVANYIGSTPTVSVGGNLYIFGDHVYDTHGGILNVTNVGGSGNITGLAYLTNASPYSYGGIGPATMALRGGSGDQSSFVGVTWTQQTGLSIMPTAGGKIGLYGATPIVKAMPVGACAGNTGCQALRDALGNPGAINTGSISN
jgi:hypothetical protein